MNSFLDYYKESIETQITAIDLFIKTESSPLPPKKTAALLDISLNEVEKIMEDEKIATINRETFFHIMRKGSGQICRIFERELICGTPRFYTVEDISYIYNLDVLKVIAAAKEMGINYFTCSMLHMLFERIPIE